MAKKTAPFPTGEDLHALLVSRDKIDDLKTHTVNYLSSLSQKAPTPQGKNMYARKIAELESNGFQPPRHVTLWGLHNVLAETNVGKLGSVLDIEAKATPRPLLHAFFDDTPLHDSRYYKGKNVHTNLQHGCNQYEDCFSDASGKHEFEPKLIEQKTAAYHANPLKVLQGIQKNLRRLYEEKKLHLQAEHIRLIEEIYFQLPDARGAVPEGPVTDPAQQQELAMRRLCILAVTALLDEKLFPEEDSPVWQWLQLQTVAAARPTVVHTSIFGSDEVDLRLLPPISVVRPAGNRKKATYETNGGKAPLEQILDSDTGAQLLLLYGTGNTSISGAGKTTMLRHLHAVLNRKGTDAAMVSLCRAYAPDVLQGEPLQKGHLYLEKALPNGQLPEDGVLILDGLDEVCSQDGVEALCHDLDALTHYAELRMRIIISSKAPYNTLPGWAMGLSGISRIFDSALKLQVLPLSRKKARQYLKEERSDELAELLSSDALLTPFYLRLLSATGALLETPLPIEQHLKARWFLDRAQSAKTPLPSEAEAFYRCLGAHVLRWFESGEGSDAANEQAAFHLFFTLPALAFHAVIHETTDPEFYFRPLPAMDEAFARNIMDGAFSFFAPTLHCFHPYRNGSGLDALAAAPPHAENFFHGPASTFFSRRYNLSRGCWQMEFVSNALKNNLAALHVANMIVALRHRQKDSPEIAAPFDQAAFLYLPRYLIHSADSYLALLSDGTADVTDFLEQLEPAKLEIPGKGRVVLCSLLYHLARFIRPNDNDDSLFFHKWLAATADAAENAGDDSLGLEFRLFYLSEESRRTRTKNLPEAQAYARQAVTLHQSFPQYIDRDEYNSLGQVYHQQVVALLNSSADAHEPLPQHWLAGPQAKSAADQMEAALAQETLQAKEAVQTWESKRELAETQLTKAARKLEAAKARKALSSPKKIAALEEACKSAEMQLKEATQALEKVRLAETKQLLKATKATTDIQNLRTSFAEISNDLEFAQTFLTDLDHLSAEKANATGSERLREDLLIAAGAELLRRAREKVELVRQLPSAPVRLELLVQSSFIAKAYTLFAVLNGSSGAACNNLACLFEENVEVWMLDESLPFWQANPELRKLFGDAGQYAYKDHYVKAYRFYDKCLNIRRGTQHYAACALLDLLLNDHLHLENGLPIPGGIHPLNGETIAKIEFLFDHIGGADNFGRQAGYQLQYWNRLQVEQGDDPERKAAAEVLFCQEWKKAMDKVGERKNDAKKAKDSRSNSPAFDIYDLCLLAQCPDGTVLSPEAPATDICRCYVHYFSNPAYRIGHNNQKILQQEWPRIRQYLNQIPEKKFPEWDELRKALDAQK